MAQAQEDKGKLLQFPTISVEDLVEEKPVEVDINGDGRFVVLCSLEAMTAQLIKDVTRLSKYRKVNPEDAVDFYAKAVADLVVEWGLTDKNGELIPLQAEAILNSVPVSLIAKIGERIMETLMPGEASGQDSETTSRAQKRGSARTGTRR